MEKKYEALKLEIMEFDNEDVITASGSGYNDGEGQDGGENGD